MRLQIVAYAPTEFFHCQHCEVVWQQLGIGQKWHAEQRESGLPPEMAAEYAAIAEWVAETAEKHGGALSVEVVDAASLQGVWKSLRHGLRQFPAFLVDDGEPIVGFDRERLTGTLENRLAQEART